MSEMMNEADQCDYVYDPNEWEPVITDATSRLPEERWECPHQTVDEQNYCLFHLPSDKREEIGIDDHDVVDGFLQALRAETKNTNEFVGASLPELNLEEEQLEATVSSPIDLRCATFSGDVKLNGATIVDDIWFSGSHFHKRCELRDATFGGKANFYGCDFDGVVESSQATFEKKALFSRSDFTYSAKFRDGAEFRGDATFTKVIFRSNASFRSTQFHGRAYFRAAEFHGDGKFNGTRFDNAVDFGDSEFIDSADFSSATFGGSTYFGVNGPHSDHGAATFEVKAEFNNIHAVENMDFEWTVFQEGLVFKESVLEAEVNFTRSSIHNSLDFIRSTALGRFIYRPINSGDGPTVVRVTGGTLTEGVLAQPLGGEAFFTFDDATIGNIEFATTTGEAYDLSHEPSDLGWARFTQTRFASFDFTSYRPNIEGDWNIHEFDREGPLEPFGLTGKELELTYMRAKSGADEIGDNRSAAGFFVKEMRGRKRRHRGRFKKAETLDEKAAAGIDYLMNGAFDQSCRYTESPLRLLFVSFVPVVAFALLYAIIGFLTRSSAPYQSSPPLLSYLIFSSESFITLVHNPGATVSLWYVRLLSVLEGYVGALLIALFLFSLTRAVHR